MFSYENHQRVSELQDGAAHAHRVAEQHGKQEHLTGHEQSRQAEAHSHDRDPHAAKPGHGPTFGHAEIEALAYQLWETRGRPQGSPEVDWFQAVKQLRSRALGL